VLDRDNHSLSQSVAAYYPYSTEATVNGNRTLGRIWRSEDQCYTNVMLLASLLQITATEEFRRLVRSRL
jgi:hypothetical protein